MGAMLRQHAGKRAFTFFI